MEKTASSAEVTALAETFAEATKRLQLKTDELARKAEAADAEIKDKGALMASTKVDVDKLLVEHTRLVAQHGELAKKKAELDARVLTVEQELVKRQPGNGTDAKKTIGQQLIEDEKFKAFAEQARGGFKGVHRLRVSQAATTSADYPAVQPGVVAPQVIPGTLPRLAQRLFVRDLLDVGQTNSPAVAYIRQTGFTNNAAVVSEGSKKPESDIDYDTKMVPVTTIAHLFKASKQILDDFAQLRTDVDRELRYGVKYAEEQEILFGDGTGVHLHGIVPQASAYQHAFVVPNMTIIDDIRLAMLQAQLARLPATGIVLHYTDWARVELTKDSTGQYLWANPMRLGGTTLWGLPVVPTEISALLGKMLVGAFATAATIYDREEVNVEIATQNNDDFEKNMLTIRCEERVALAVRRPEAFIYGAFTVTT